MRSGHKNFITYLFGPFTCRIPLHKITTAFVDVKITCSEA